MSIPFRTIAGTRLHPVGLGCMNLSWAYGTPPSAEEGARLLHRALDLGCNHLDTARIYGGGQNEALIGRSIGLAYDDECLSFSVAYNSVLANYSDIVPTQEVWLRVQLRTLGGTTFVTDRNSPLD